MPKYRVDVVPLLRAEVAGRDLVTLAEAHGLRPGSDKGCYGKLMAGRRSAAGRRTHGR